MRPRRASDAALVRKCCSSGDEITASRDAGGQGACTSCSADCQMLRLKVAGCRRGQPELPGAARPACASEGAPVPLQHSPCLPSPCKCQPQKPRPGWRPCHSVDGRQAGVGAAGSLQLFLPTEMGGVLVSGGRRDRCRRHGLSPEAKGLKSRCHQAGFLAGAVGTALSPVCPSLCAPCALMSPLQGQSQGRRRSLTASLHHLSPGQVTLGGAPSYECGGDISVHHRWVLSVAS